MQRFFSATFYKNLIWHVIFLWVIISYKIIKFVSISYKMCCEGKLTKIYYNIFFHNKIQKYFLKGNLKQN